MHNLKETERHLITPPLRSNFPSHAQPLRNHFPSHARPLRNRTPSYHTSSKKPHPPSHASPLRNNTPSYHVSSQKPHAITCPPRNQPPTHHDRTHSSRTPDTTEHSTASLLNLTQPSTSVSVNHTRHNTPTSRTLHDTPDPSS